MLLSILFIALLGASYTPTNIPSIGNPTPNVFKDKKCITWNETIRQVYSNQLNTETLTKLDYDGAGGGNWNITLSTRNKIKYQEDYYTIEQVNITNYYIDVYNEEGYLGANQNFDNIHYYSYTLTKIKTFNDYADIIYYQDILQQNQTIYDQNNYKYEINPNDLQSRNNKIWFVQVNATTNLAFNTYWNQTLTYLQDNYDEPEETLQDQEEPNYYAEYYGNEIEYSNNTFKIYEKVTNDEPPLWDEIILVEERYNTTSDYARYYSIYNNNAEIGKNQDLYNAYINTLYDINGNPRAPTFNIQTYKNLSIELDIRFDNPSAQSGEVIDIGGLMWDIIGMPFTFINMAFNVTLFPGTIYQLNIGNLIKGLIAILTLLFIIKVFTGGLNVIGNYTGNIEKASQNREDRKWIREERQMKREKHKKEMKE